MKTNPIKIVSKSIIGLIMVLVFTECSEKIIEPPRPLNELVISEYIASNNDFSDFNDLLLSTGLNNLLSIRGPYSLFLPNNAAMQAYYTEKNITLAGMDSASMRELVLNHLVPFEYGVSDYQLGTLKEKNGNGDNVVTEFLGAEIYINKYARITKRDVRVSNGTIQIIDKVLDPIKLSVYDKLAADPGYSIFTKGLELTGLKDTLQIISFPYGLAKGRTRFTVLAVADSTYINNSIHNIDDLIAQYTNKPDSIKKPDNGFYMYMDYHCLNNAMYSNDFTSTAFPYSTLSKNSAVQVVIEKRIVKINKLLNGTYTSIYADQSNVPAKNGVFHTISSLLEHTTPIPSVLVWETTDYFDLKQGEYYLRHFQKFYDTAQFKGIWWKGEYLQYYIKLTDAPVEMNYDCLNMYGFWEIEVTTPRIMKGRYKVNGRVWPGNIDFAVYLDGVQVCIIKKGDTPGEKGYVKMDTNNLYFFSEVLWETTTEHKIKLVALSSGMLFWDRMEFVPK